MDKPPRPIIHICFLLALLLSSAWTGSSRGANTADPQRISATTRSSTVPLGGPVIITWSILPDGLTLPKIYNAASNPNPVSDLISRMDVLYNIPAAERTADLTARLWRQDMQSMLELFAAKTGLSYVYITDDGANFGAGGNAVRGDVRIGGTALVNVLGYNGFPDSGSDMVLNTGGTTFANRNSLKLIFAHEHAHGLGLGHVLVAGNASLSVVSGSGGNLNGPQHDDLLPLQRKYGDAREKFPGNDTRAVAGSLGTVTAGAAAQQVGSSPASLTIAAAATDFVSVDGTDDPDWYSFTLTSPLSVTALLSPRGITYNYVPEGGSDTAFDTRTRSDLRLRFYSSAGTLVETADATGIGGNEALTNRPLAAGTWFVEVTGKTNAAQFYNLKIFSGMLDSDSDGLPDTLELAGDPDADGLQNAEDPDSDGDGAWDGAETDAGRDPLDVTDLGFEFNAAGSDPAEGWTAQNTGAGMSVGDGLFRGAASSGDPQFLRSGLSINGSTLTGLLFRYRASAAGDVQLFWGYNGGGFNATQSRTASYPVAGGFQTVYFDLTGNAGWIGRRITSLRIDPPGGTGTTFALDWVRGTDGDRDGDGTVDQQEIDTARDLFNAADLATTFEIAGNSEGWGSYTNITTPAIAGGKFTGTAASADPTLTKSNYDFSGSAISGLLLRMECVPAGSAQIFWGHLTANNISGTRAATAPWPGGTGFRTVYFPMSDSTDWTGKTITRLRLDPINLTGAAFAIDSLRGSTGDFDRDGIPDTTEGTADPDNDTLANLEDADSDGDALPDAWEFAYGFDFLSPAGADNDTDGDGFTNRQEYAAGTLPLNPASRTEIRILSSAGPSRIFGTEGKAGRRYQLERSTGLTTSAWTIITVTGPLPADGPVTLTDPAAPFLRAFHRIRILFP